MFFKRDQEMVCILWMSVSFMILWAAEATLSNMEKTIVSSITDDKPDFHLEGYTVPGLGYTVFALSSWIGPYICYTAGPRATMFIAAIGYAFHTVAFALEKEWVIYSAAVVNGVAAGILWPAQGCYLVENSLPQTVARNSAILLLFQEGSSVFGNTIVYFMFEGKEYINNATRRTTMYILIAINILALISFSTVPKCLKKRQNQDYSLIKTLKRTWGILLTPRMSWFALVLVYIGLEQSFIEGVYSPAIGFTMVFGSSAKELVALSGICKSIGCITGAVLPMVFCGWIRKNRYSRKLIFFTGVVIQLISFLIIFINLPNSSVFGSTFQTSLIYPSAFLSLLVSFLISFSDECFSTQTYSFLGEFYRESSAEAFALYKCIKAVFKAANFYASSLLGLHLQVAIMAVVAIIGLVAFFLADQDSTLSEYKKEDTKSGSLAKGKT